MSFYKDLRSSDVKVIEYNKDYAIRNLGMTIEDIDKYGCPMGLKYEGCDVVIPIPSNKSVRSNMKKVIQKEQEETKFDSRKAGEIVSTKLAKEFFM